MLLKGTSSSIRLKGIIITPTTTVKELVKENSRQKNMKSTMKIVRLKNKHGQIGC